MITPAVLISACGSMILSTSHRLGRVVDRVRALSDKLEELATKQQIDPVGAKERQAVIFAQLDKLTSRARILQRSMVTFYLALGMFVATSVAIGVVAVVGNSRYNVVPVIVGLAGRVLSFLWQHAADIRGASGPQHDPRGDGFHLAANDESRACGGGGATQTALRPFPASRINGLEIPL